MVTAMKMLRSASQLLCQLFDIYSALQLYTKAYYATKGVWFERFSFRNCRHQLAICQFLELDPNKTPSQVSIIYIFSAFPWL